MFDFVASAMLPRLHCLLFTEAVSHIFSEGEGGGVMYEKEERATTNGFLPPHNFARWARLDSSPLKPPLLFIIDYLLS